MTKLAISIGVGSVVLAAALAPFAALAALGCEVLSPGRFDEAAVGRGRTPTTRAEVDAEQPLEVASRVRTICG